MLQKTKLGAVVLNHGDNADSLRLTHSLLESGLVESIAVVDNTGVGGLTGREDVFEGKTAFLILSENGGYAACNNRGIRMLMKKVPSLSYILISNPDVFVSPEALTKTIEFLDSHPEFAVAAPHMLDRNGMPHDLTGWKQRSFYSDIVYCSGLLYRLFSSGREKYPEEHWKGAFSEVECISGSFFIIRADIFGKLGYFDEHTFLFFEEDIIGYKLKRLGYRTAVLNDCSFLHYEGVSKGKDIHHLRKYRIMQKSRFYFHRHYLHTVWYQYALMCLATGLGFMENLIKDCRSRS